MKPSWQRWWWPAGKLVLALVILVFVGRRFYFDLQELESHPLRLRPEGLGLSSGLYLVGLCFSAFFWQRLLVQFGQTPERGAAARAYFIGHLGKYVPGKAWALLLRGTLVHGPKVRLGAAVITGFYEVLTTMAAGALLAALVFLWQPPSISGLTWSPLFTGLLLLVLFGVPLWPGVFNLLVARLAVRFQMIESFRLPQLRLLTLLEGLGLTACGWGVLGLSLWAMFYAILPEPPPLGLETWARYTAVLSLAWVAGFLAIVVPGGVGVREFLLLTLLRGEGPEPLVAAAVLLARLLWTLAELLLAAVLWSRGSRVESRESRVESRETRG